MFAKRMIFAQRVGFLLLLFLLRALASACGEKEGGTTAPPTTAAASSTVTTAPPTTAATSSTVTTAAPSTTTTVTTKTQTAADPRPGPVPSQFTVTLDPANGQASFTASVENSARPLPSLVDPQKAGEVFLGWFYDAGEWQRPYRGEIIVADVTLTARYAEEAHTVHFAAPDATLDFASVRVASGEALTDLPTARRATDAATDWYYDAALTTPYRGEPITADLTLYPAYTPYLAEGATTLPALYINTAGGAAVTSKEDYLRATLTVVGGKGDALSEVGLRIRGRGNSTWRFFDKKPYRLKLDSSADLLGLGKEKDFVLLANAGDPTMLHNYALFSLAELFGDTVTSKCVYVSLYLNGAYEGVYLLCEQNEVGKERVPIDDGASGAADVGYLIEFGGNAADPPKYGFTLNPVTVGGKTYAWRAGFTATVKSPDEKTITAAQKSYITDYVNRVNRAIFSGDYATFTTLCDVDSFVSALLANMLLLNNDMDYSLYFYKPAGEKLCFGPLWDADQAAGTSTKTGTITEGWEVSRYDHWFTALLRMPEFRTEVEKAWQTYRDEILLLPDYFMVVAFDMIADIEANELRHAAAASPYWRQCEEHFGYTTYEEHLAFFRTWLTERIAWMDAELSKKAP